MSSPIILDQAGIIQNQEQNQISTVNNQNQMSRVEDQNQSEEIRHINQIFDIIQSNETNDYYGVDVQLERSKLKQIAKEGKLTLKSGQGIKSEGFLPSITRKNILYLGKFTSEQPLEISTAVGQEALSLVNGKQIADRIAKMKQSDKEKIQYIHLSTIQILVKSTYASIDRIAKMKQSDKEKIQYIHLSTIQILVKSTYASIDTPMDIIVIDNRIISKNKKEQVLGIIKGNLKYGVIKFDVSLHFAIPLVTKNLSQSIGILYKFHRQDLMEKGDYPLSITYSVGYALSNSHHSVDYIDQEIIHIDDLFKNTSTKLVTFEKKNENANDIFKAPPVRMIKPREDISKPTITDVTDPLKPTTSSSIQLAPPPNLHRKPESMQNLEKQIQELRRTVTNLNEKI
uniref:Putative cell to cell movement protein n=1 Tax=Blueberry red ringspot virus TaxID=172220 RepID=A0A8F5VTL3_9VIRU|nr:putative cell to cell movement protein [Blueberry red ringspot virus]